MKHLKTGQTGEEIAKRFLERNGYSILAKNWRDKHGEIDIVARDRDKTLLFIEVKTMNTDVSRGTSVSDTSTQDFITDTNVSRETLVSKFLAIFSGSNQSGQNLLQNVSRETFASIKSDGAPNRTIRQSGNSNPAIAGLLPEDQMTAAKIKKFRGAVEAFIFKYPDAVNDSVGFRLDVLAVSLDESKDLVNIRHYKNAC